MALYVYESIKKKTGKGVLNSVKGDKTKIVKVNYSVSNYDKLC